MKKCVGVLMALLVCGLVRSTWATDYSIYEGQATIDGNLSEWADATWFPLTVASSGTGTDLTDAKFAVRWSSATNLIYVAVTGVDTEHVFIDPSMNVGTWDSCDSVEVYLDAPEFRKVSYSYAVNGDQSYWKYAQQYCGGLKTDGSVWCALGGQDGYNGKNTEAIASGIVSFAATTNGDTLNYEFALKPYKIFNIDNPSASVMMKLQGGHVIGFDVDMISKSSSDLVTLSENTMTKKFQFAANLQTYTLVGTNTESTDMEFVKIDHSGNAADVAPKYGYDKTPRGAVVYEYYIGKYELTVAQYAKFLNAVAVTSDVHGLFSSNMATQTKQITKTIQQDNTFVYTVLPGWADRPMGYVTWADAARYCNWMTTGGTETGVYNFNADGTWGWDQTYSETNPYGINLALRNGSASAYWIPNFDEYYKAAYYDPSAEVYYDFPTSTNNTPSAGIFDSANSGNWAGSATTKVFTIGSPFWLTEVGTFQYVQSPYGCYDMFGNSYEWTENFLTGKLVTGSTTDHYYGPTYHGGSYYGNTALYANVDYFTNYIANGLSTNNYGVNIGSFDQGVRVCCNQAAIDATSRIPGDANGDKKVDVSDLGILAANYGKTSGATWQQGDFNGDGKVDVSDLGILAANYGRGSQSATDFNADYAKVFGTASTENNLDDTTGNTICSSLGLPLVAGLMLFGLMLVKLEE